VLILREVLGFSAREVAGALDTTVASVNSAMQRARKTVEERMPPITQQATLQAVGDEHTRAIVRQYTDALESGDVDAVIALLTEDATWSMPPLPEWYGGHASIVTFLERGPMQERWRHIATRANGQPAVACYMWNDEAGAYAAKVIDVLTLRGERIAAVTSFIGGSQFSRFELPPVYPDGAGGTLATSPPTS
jgi:RNA polymerase sigma-70 factor (ECF subfamily)